MTSQGKLCRVVSSLLAAIAQHTPLEIYAQTRGPDFWYKVYIFAPWGVLRMDTGGESVRSRPRARAIIRHERLQAVTLDALMANWQQYGLWPHRVIGLRLYETWRDTHEPVLHHSRAYPLHRCAAQAHSSGKSAYGETAQV